MVAEIILAIILAEMLMSENGHELFIDIMMWMIAIAAFQIAIAMVVRIVKWIYKPLIKEAEKPYETKEKRWILKDE